MLLINIRQMHLSAAQSHCSWSIQSVVVQPYSFDIADSSNMGCETQLA